MHEGLSALENECISYSLYLIGRTPNRYVIDKYCEAHTEGGLLPIVPVHFLDRFLARIPRRVFLLRLVDSFTLLFASNCVLRKKWLLLIGILESSEPTSLYFDQPDPGSRAILIGNMICNGILFVICVAMSTILFGVPALILTIYEKFFRRSH